MAYRGYAGKSGGDKRSRVAIIVALVLGLGGMAVAPWAEPAAPVAVMSMQAAAGDASGTFVRIHVVPHSDEPSDQDAKLIVRDAVLAEMAAMLGHVDPQAWLRELNNDVVLERLRARAEVVLRGLGKEYGARISWGEEPLSAEHRAQMDLPGVQHPALRVVLGEGQGSNWWCVLFPPLCFVAPAQGFNLVQWAHSSEVNGGDGISAALAKGVHQPGVQGDAELQEKEAEGAAPRLAFRLRVLEALKPTTAGESFLSRAWD